MQRPSGRTGRFLALRLGQSWPLQELNAHQRFGAYQETWRKLLVRKQYRVCEEDESNCYQVIVNSFHYLGNNHGNGMLKTSMLAKSSAIEILTASHPINFGTGNPLYLLEFLLSLSETIPLSLIFLAFMSDRLENRQVDNALLVVNCKDLVQVLKAGIFPGHFAKTGHLLRLLMSFSTSLDARDEFGHLICRGILVKEAPGQRMLSDKQFSNQPNLNPENASQQLVFVGAAGNHVSAQSGRMRHPPLVQFRSILSKYAIIKFTPENYSSTRCNRCPDFAIESGRASLRDGNILIGLS
ncbi:hypothetical protein MIR68_008062 [Amoeboaphelidium protococcarum]|nr:hypothetical protein MIR68_008062 [Amoeboaphelidium protococcarum]